MSDKPSDRRPRPDDKPYGAGTDILVLALVTLLAGGWYLLTARYYIQPSQLVELALWTASFIVGTFIFFTIRLKKAKTPEEKSPSVSLWIKPETDQKHVKQARLEKGIVLGYDRNKRPFVWTDGDRSLQSIIVGMTGAGKTTVQANIITQDIYRDVPVIIIDGKGDLEFYDLIISHALRARRLHQFKIIAPARPDISSFYNPFWGSEKEFLSRAEMVFGAFGVRHEFFGQHQRTYLLCLAHILWRTGKYFNFRDLLIMAKDKVVQQEQIEIAERNSAGLPAKQKENLRAAVHELQQLWEDRDHLAKVQGLIDQLLPFIQHEDLEAITGSYSQIVNPQLAIDNNLILYVSLNLNKKSEPLKILGRIILQDLQYIIGEKYEDEVQRSRAGRPFVSVILDEFASFTYLNFAHIMATARGSNTGFLLSLQTDWQLRRADAHLGHGFMEEVLSHANNKIMLRNRHYASAERFVREAARFPKQRYTWSVEKSSLLGFEQAPALLTKGTMSDVGAATADPNLLAHILQMPTGHMDVLITSHTRGSVHEHLVVRTPEKLPSQAGWRPLPPIRLPEGIDPEHGAYLKLRSNVLNFDQRRRHKVIINPDT
jgi:hypothetical protein